MMKAKFVQGNQACVEAAIAAGMRFYAGYPITPSTEIAELSAEWLPEVGGRFIQMEDEIASMGAIIGASLAGVKSMTATSGPGFSLMQENLGYACFTEVPCVIINVMRGGPSTGLPTMPAQGDVMQVRWGTHGDHPIIVLAPNSVNSMYRQTIRAFNLSEKYRVPVIVAVDEVIAHMREKLEIPESIEIVDRKKPAAGAKNYQPFKPDDDMVPPMACYGEKFHFNVTGLTHDESGFPTSAPEKVAKLQKRLHDKIRLNTASIVEVEEYMTQDAEIAVFAYGSTSRSALSAVKTARSKGIKAGLFCPLTLWPFPEEAVRGLAERVRTLVVAEMNLGQMLLEVERAAAGRCAIVPCLQADGELITPETILKGLDHV